MLLHVAIRSVGLIYRLHFPLGNFATCTAPTGRLQITINVIILLRSDYVTNLSLKPDDILPCLGNLFIISA